MNVGAAERYLEQLLAPGTPSHRFEGALSALRGAGVLDDDAYRRWRTRATAAQAPWLTADELAELESRTGHTLIRIPGESPEADATAEAELQAQLELMVRRGRSRRVYLAPTLDREAGLTIVAVVTRTECTEVTFHHVGGPQGDAQLDAFGALVDSLVPPRLTDDVGTLYTPVSDRPVGATGTGGPPDPSRPWVVSGTWRYQPPAPDTATTFTVRGAEFTVRRTAAPRP